MVYTSKSAEETQKLGEHIAAYLKPGDVLCLYGDLGSGKTTFVQGIAKGLEIEEIPNSPTFIIQREYPVTKNGISTLYHLDLYRMENESDIQSTGISSTLKEKDAVVIIEWPEKALKLLPEKRIDVHFSHQDDSRAITLPEQFNNLLASRQVKL